jgi:hypothetical protein
MWTLNLRGDEAILSPSAFCSCSALVVFPEAGRPENITRGIRVAGHCVFEEDQRAELGGDLHLAKLPSVP